MGAGPALLRQQSAPVRRMGATHGPTILLMDAPIRRRVAIILAPAGVAVRTKMGLTEQNAA